MQLDQVISNPDLEGDYSPIYTTEKKGSVPVKKLVRTRYFFLVNLPYYVFLKWIRPDSLFLVLELWAAMAPESKKKKKTSPDPFCCSKALCKRILVPYNLLYVSLP